jgi:hypothetical protein
MQNIQEILTTHLNRLLDSRDHPKLSAPPKLYEHWVPASSLPVIYHHGEMQYLRSREYWLGNGDRGGVEVLQKGNVLEGDLGEGLEHVVGPLRASKVL